MREPDLHNQKGPGLVAKVRFSYFSQIEVKYRIPMALANDHLWGYTTDIITKFKVRWIEMAAVLPMWTNMIVYYVEGHEGNVEVGL